MRTNLSDNLAALRPVPLGRAAPELPAVLAAAMMPPETAGEIVLRGIERNDDLIVTNPELWPRVAAGQEEIRRRFGA